LDLDDSKDSFPDMTNDPFTPSTSFKDVAKSKQSHSATLGSKPLAPPTRALVELPTCPVCLERMDESTGLLTILCQHVFHCTCLMKWRKSGCPVCRFTQEGTLRKGSITGEEEEALNECSICRSELNLWICLICGNVGCGRYDGAHAFLHYKQTGHCFAMDLTDQRVWDYGSDGYVHRIMQNKTDGKMMELPSAAADYDNNSEDDQIPRTKLDAMSVEYTHLLTSQLDSQRAYYEEKLERAADKASQATKAANQATEATMKALTQLTEVQALYEKVIKDTIPDLERERDRATRKANKFEEMFRNLEKEWRAEKTEAEGLLERVTYMEKEMSTMKGYIADLEDTNHDLTAYFSAAEKLRNVNDDDIVMGSLALPENDQPEKKSSNRKRKNKGKGKGGREAALQHLTGNKGESSVASEKSGNATEADEDVKSEEELKSSEGEAIRTSAKEEAQQPLNPALI
jgi:BRCA1-associated protein